MRVALMIGEGRECLGERESSIYKAAPVEGRHYLPVTMRFLVSRAILSLLVVASLVVCVENVLVKENTYIYYSYGYEVTLGATDCLNRR